MFTFFISQDQEEASLPVIKATKLATGTSDFKIAPSIAYCIGASFNLF